MTDPQLDPLTCGDPRAAEPVVACLAAGLADQHRRLEKELRTSPVDLEWQPSPGRNSIGMLLAHNAIVEVWWFAAAAKGMKWDDADGVLRERLGIGGQDDGMPCPADGGHPAVLRGWPLERYLDLLAKARACTAEHLAAWRDSDLGEVVGGFRRPATRGWILYHALERFAQHAGQITLLAAMQRAKTG
jgi:hypothetical protein